MDIEQARLYCLSKKATTEGMPFGDGVFVFKVIKMFALLSLNGTANTMNLKCDPERSIELRQEWDGAIIPGYHMNKKHWNTIDLDQLPEDLILELIDHSYDLVFKSLRKKDRELLG